MTSRTQSTEATAAWPAGFRIQPRGAGPTPDMIEAFRGVPTAWASDCLGRSTGSIGLTAYHGSLTLMMCGPAVTVRVRPGDNLMIHKALEIAQSGDVILVDGGGDVSQALIGGNMRITAIQRGIAGFVLDGAVRDIADFAEGVIGCYARGHTHRGPSKEGPGEINVPICCSGMIVNPGDLILGDADGVIAIPPFDLPALLPRIKKQAEKEANLAKINAAGTADPERFNAILRAKGCLV